MTFSVPKKLLANVWNHMWFFLKFCFDIKAIIEIIWHTLVDSNYRLRSNHITYPISTSVWHILPNSLDLIQSRCCFPKFNFHQLDLHTLSICSISSPPRVFSHGPVIMIIFWLLASSCVLLASRQTPELGLISPDPILSRLDARRYGAIISSTSFGRGSLAGWLLKHSWSSMLDGEEQLERRSTKPDAKAGAPRNCYNYPRVTLLYYLLLYGSVVLGSALKAEFPLTRGFHRVFCQKLWERKREETGSDGKNQSQLIRTFIDFYCGVQ